MKETIEYNPVGVCAKKMIFTVENGMVVDAKIIGGCPGNSEGICKLIIGMNITDIINRLKNIKCGFKNTSCPAQISMALQNYKRD